MKIWLIGYIIRLLPFKAHLVLLVAVMIYGLFMMVSTGTILSITSFLDKVVEPDASVRNYFMVSSLSLSPYTSLVSYNRIVEKLDDINISATPVILAVVTCNGRVVGLRGVTTSGLELLYPSTSIDGRSFSDNCIGCVWAGEQVAEKLGLAVNDTIIVYSPYTGSSYVLRVQGIIDGGGVLNYELLTNIDTARIIHGAVMDEVSYIIVSARSQEELRVAAERLNHSYPTSIVEKAFLVLGPRNRATVYKSYTSIFLTRIGLNEWIVTILYGTILFTLSLGFYVIGQSYTIYSRCVLSLLWVIGVPKKIARVLLAFTITITVSIAFLISVVIQSLLSPYLTIWFLGYPLAPSTPPLYMLILHLSITLITITGSFSVKPHE